MREQIELLKQDPEREFNQTEFLEHRLFPWALDSRTWTKIIVRDKTTENILKARIEGEGYNSRYFIKGKNILTYINKYGSLMMSSIYNRSNGKNKKARKTTSAKEKGKQKRI